MGIRRGWTFAGAFATLVGFNVAAIGLVFGHGLAFSMSLAGAAVQLALTAGLAASLAAVVRWGDGRAPSALGLRADRAAVVELVGGVAAGVSGVAALVGALWAAGGLELHAVGGGVGAAALLLVASTVNAAFQQLGLQGLGAAGSGPAGRSIAAFCASAVVFLGAHAGGSPLYLCNVALFAAVTIALFRPGAAPSLAAPSGFHGGWNAAMVWFGTIPDAPGAFVATPADSGWAGGAAGIESGGAYTVAIGVALALAVGYGRLAGSPR